VALAVLVAGAVGTVGLTPAVSAAGQEPGSQSQQAGKPEVESKSVDKTVTVYRHAGEPVTVTVDVEPGQAPRVTTHAIQGAPMIAAIGGGPRLGVQIRDLGKDDLATLKLSTPNGVVVDEVTSASAAEKAGVKAGDVVVQFDGENVRSAAQFTRLVRETVAGRSVKMGVVRDGKRVDLDVAPAEAENLQQFSLERRTPAPGGTFTWEGRVPAPEQPIPPAGAPRRQQRIPMPDPEGDTLQWFGEGGAGAGSFVFSASRGRLGVNVQELTPELAAYFGVKDGLLVNSVQADTPAAKAGFKAGDVIGTVNGKTVSSSSDLVRELADKEGEVAIGLTRDKKALSLKATLEPRKTPARRAVVVGRPA
jgi:membrane-associated protease RseP (regulator of RpoE activity)